MTGMTYRAVSEKTIYINLPKTNGLKIKGILRGDFTKPLVVMMHGRPGSGNELLQYLGACYLHEHGFSTLRLFMYDFGKQFRDMLDTTLDSHVQDFDTVVTYLRAQNAKHVFAVGHSYGGLTILKSEAQLDGAVLWDPTHGLIFHKEGSWRQDFPTETCKNFVIGVGGHGYVDSKVNKRDQLRMGDNTEWAAHKGYPLKIISAGNGAMTQLGKKYISVADLPKEHAVIEGASHQFHDSDTVMLKLFEETHTWLERFTNDRQR